MNNPKVKNKKKFYNEFMLPRLFWPKIYSLSDPKKVLYRSIKNSKFFVSQDIGIVIII